MNIRYEGKVGERRGKLETDGVLLLLRFITLLQHVVVVFHLIAG